MLEHTSNNSSVATGIEHENGCVPVMDQNAQNQMRTEEGLEELQQ